MSPKSDDAQVDDAHVASDDNEPTMHDGMEIPVEVEVGESTAPTDAVAEDDDLLLRVGELESANAKLASEKQEHWDRLLRATADLENVRKRSRREVDDARIDARTNVLKEMLPVVDNLERAVTHAEEKGHGADPEAAAIIEGVKLCMRQFAQALEKFSVVAVEAAGQPFDPSVHEAISQIESAEHAPGTVVQAYQRGYKIGERLLRPALVVVAKASATAAAEPSAEGAQAAEPVPQPSEGADEASDS